MKRLTQRIILPNEEKLYFLEGCVSDCLNENHCQSCPRFKNAMTKLGQYEDVTDPATMLIRHARREED